MITSAYFFDGRTKSSNAGLTNFAYYKPTLQAVRDKYAM